MSAQDWFILRCAGRSTLPLAKTLAEDGFEVWTPVRTQTIRVPRMNVRREVKLPLLPSFVFARAEHMVDLIALEKRPGRHHEFTVFRMLPRYFSWLYAPRLPTIRDKDLEPLRLSEQRAVPKKDQPRFDRGARVRAHSGVFEGMRGKVERCRDGKVQVIFEGGSKRWEIPAFLLSEEQAINATSVAKAA
jgi:transcription antitermination factor NusG